MPVRSPSKTKTFENVAVLRLSRLPNYFGESELQMFLRQFGKIKDIHMPKSKKTLKTKGFAFVKVSKEIAPHIVATLDGVLNFNKIMKCELVDDPNWGAFRRRRSLRSSGTVVELRRQALSALKRSKRVNRPGNSTGATQSQSLKTTAQRRRCRNFKKRVDTLTKSHPGLTFTAV